jgi:hypothetical protein
VGGPIQRVPDVSVPLQMFCTQNHTHTHTHTHTKRPCVTVVTQKHKQTVPSCVCVCVCVCVCAICVGCYIVCVNSSLVGESIYRQVIGKERVLRVPIDRIL